MGHPPVKSRFLTPEGVRNDSGSKNLFASIFDRRHAVCESHLADQISFAIKTVSMQNIPIAALYSRCFQYRRQENEPAVLW